MSGLPGIKFDDNGISRSIYQLPPTTARDRPSLLVFALPKSGSVLLSEIMRALCDDVGMPFVDIMGEYFKLGIPREAIPPDTSGIFVDTGYCYGAFRYMPLFDIPILPRCKKMLLVRDPRDMVVSHYYSMLKSHPLPGNSLASSRPILRRRDVAQRLGLDAYARDIAPVFQEYLRQYRDLCRRDTARHYRSRKVSSRILDIAGGTWRRRSTRGVRIYRYEDVIYAKEDWIRDICDWFGFAVDRARQAAIAKSQDVFPPSENEEGHIRQVHPGDHKRKLGPATIEYLTKLFAADLAFFGYES